MRTSKKKSSSSSHLSSKKVINPQATKRLEPKRKKVKKQHLVSQLPASKSVEPVEASDRVTEVLKQLHQLQPRQPTQQSDHATDKLAQAQPLPLKKPRAERLAFLAPLTDGAGGGEEGGPDAKASPLTTARSKKKRRKLKLAKRKLQQEELKTATESNESKLESARFRYLNEQLYTRTGSEAMKMFSEDRESFDAYHQGFRNQVAKWPVNPLHLIIKNINKMPPSHLVVDLGCGDALLSASVRQRVLSFDLVATNDRVTACDMAHLPMEDGTANVAVLCLALMGTNLSDFVTETNRVLKMGGQLRIAEVASRFDSVDDFVRDLRAYGFHFISQDLTHKYFYMFSLKKVANVERRRRKELPEITLKPCLYKRR